jgi:hypothetical protein
VKFRTVVLCSRCQQPIISVENFGFVCFKIPSKEGAGFAAGTAGKAS